MISSLFIYTQRGDLIVTKALKDSIRKSNSLAEVFRVQVIIGGGNGAASNFSDQGVGNGTGSDNGDTRSPILTLGSTTFHHIYKNNMWIVAVSRNNVDSGLVWEYLCKLHGIMVEMYAINNDELLRDNFWTVYEILDHTLNVNGVPFDTDMHSLCERIVSKKPADLSKLTLAHNKEGHGLAGKTGSMSSYNPATAVTKDISNIPWRKNQDIHYKKNEIYINVLENVNLLISKTGEILKNNIDGKINVDARLSGIPLVSFELTSNSVDQSSMKFHECVKLEKRYRDGEKNWDDYSKQEGANLITFVPPDGPFELLAYHSVGISSIPFSIVPTITQTVNNKTSNIEMHYSIKIKSLFANKIATNVVMRIPLTDSTADCSMELSGGKCKMVSANNHKKFVEWTFAKFKGSTEHFITLTAKTTTASPVTTQFDRKDTLNVSAKQQPISLAFEISMYNGSGLTIKNDRVRNQLISKNGTDHQYKVHKWIKYDTRAGNYEVRF